MEISQHIKNLLLTNPRVILGNFGAFETKHIPAKIDKETKTMVPPFKIVVFNPDVKEDAGLLAKHMAEKEGITVENANEQISEFVKTVKTKLEKGEVVKFTDLGEFKKTADGKIDFSYLSEDNLLLDSFGLPKVSLEEETKPVISPEKNKKTEPLKKVPEKKPLKNKTVKQKPVKKTAPVKKQKPVKQKKEKQKDGKKKRFWPVLLIIIGALGILIAAVYFFKPDLWQKGYSFAQNKIAAITGGNDNLEIITPEDVEGNETEGDEIVPDTVAGEDIVADTTETAEENISEETTENVDAENTEEPENQTENISENETANVNTEVVVNTSAGSASAGKYYIIIGSVKTEPAAQKEQKRYAAKGISTDIIYVPHMERYRISIGEFSSAKAAQDFFIDFQNEHGNIDAWVWEKK